MYYLYLIRCAGNRLYTGITTDPARRFREHRGEKPGGARFTGANPPESLEMVWTAPDRSAAQRAEYRLKHRTRVEKERLIAHPEELPGLLELPETEFRPCLEPWQTALKENGLEL